MTTVVAVFSVLAVSVLCLWLTVVVLFYAGHENSRDIDGRE